LSFSENLDEFINADTPGYVLAIINGTPVHALFDNAYLEDYNVASRNPFIHVKEADVLSTPVGATVLIGAINYKTVAPFEADGHGIAVFQLEKQ
jgi:hypothetical protein